MLTLFLVPSQVSSLLLVSLLQELKLLILILFLVKDICRAPAGAPQISLATLWSGVFAIWSGMIALAGPSMLVHSILLIGIYFTADIFKMADKKSPSNHRAAYRDPKDGCSRYDDLWGA